MAQEDEKKYDLFEGLSEAEQKRLYDRMKLLEDRLFYSTLKRLRNYLIVAVGVIGIVGIVSALGLKASIEDAATGRLVGDEALRTRIADAAQEHVEAKSKALLSETQEAIEEATSLSEQLLDERINANLILANNLQDIVAMLEQLRDDMARLSTEGKR